MMANCPNMPVIVLCELNPRHCSHAKQHQKSAWYPVVINKLKSTHSRYFSKSDADSVSNTYQVTTQSVPGHPVQILMIGLVFAGLHACSCTTDDVRTSCRQAACTTDVGALLVGTAYGPETNNGPLRMCSGSCSIIPRTSVGKWDAAKELESEPTVLDGTGIVFCTGFIGIL